MGQIARAIFVASWLVGVAIYVLILGTAVADFYSFAKGMSVVTEGPFWPILQRYKTILTTLVPAILILGPIVYWIYGGIKEEKNELKRQVGRP
jgi:hypothetical protein